MKHKQIRGTFRKAATFAFILIAALWSWNEVAVPFGAPEANFKQILAASVLLIILRWVLTPGPDQHQQITTGARDEH